MTKLDIFNKTQLKKEAPDIRPGDIIRVFLKLPEKTKKGGQKTQAFEGLVIARKHGKGPNATFTVRKISEGVGVERIFPIFCPTITKIDLVKRSKVRRAKLYYMRKLAGKKARMKTKKLLGIEWEAPEKEAPTEVGVPTEVGKKVKEETKKVESPEERETKSAEAESEGGKEQAEPKEDK